MRPWSESGWFVHDGQLEHELEQLVLGANRAADELDQKLMEATVLYPVPVPAQSPIVFQWHMAYMYGIHVWHW